MRLAFVNSTRKWGGVKSWTLDVAGRLIPKGHEVFLIAREGPFLDKAAGMGIQAAPCSFGFDFHPGLITRFRRSFREQNIDLVICNVAKDLRSAGMAGKLAGIPVVQRIGSQGDLENTFKIRLVHRFVQPVLLTNCKDLKDKLLAKLPFLTQEEVVYFLPGKPPRQEPPPKRPDPTAPLNIITTNKLVKGKAMDDLFQALATLKGKGHTFHLDIVGDGPLEGYLRLLAEELDIADRITWLGFRTDVADQLDRADVFCLPSLAEGNPQGLLEALARGLIPVARGVGGIPEVWPQGLEHLLTPPGPGPEGLVTALESVLLAEEETREGWKHIGWNKCVEDLNVDIQTAKLEKWLLTLTSSKKT
jgi:glycosyltransferase involved in cell wall biosynthesis